MVEVGPQPIARTAAVIRGVRRRFAGIAIVAVGVTSLATAPIANANDAAAGDDWLKWLAGLGGTITLEADTVEVDKLIAHDVRLPVRLGNGTAELERASARTGDDTIALGGRYVFAENHLTLAASGERIALPAVADPTTQTRLFDDMPLFPYRLPRLAGDIDIRFDQATIGETAITALAMQTTLASGGLDVALSATIGGGTLEATFAHTYATTATRIDARGSGIAIEALPAFSGYISGAALDFEASLSGRGSTPHALVANVDGAVRADLGPGLVDNLELDRLTQNLLSMTLWSVIPFKNPTPQTRLECAAVRFDIANGRVATERGLIVSTEKLILSGRGQIDLDTEALALELLPEVDQGFVPGAAGKPRTVAISGSLLRPQLTASAGGLLHESLSLGTSWATAPFSRAAGNVLDWSRRSPQSCASMLTE